MNESDFNAAIEKTKDFIYKGKSKPFIKWIKALDSYLHLLKNKYTSGDIKEAFSKAKHESSKDDFFAPSLHSIEREFIGDMYNEDVDLLRKELLPKVANKTNKEKSSALQESFILSWNQASYTIYKSYDFKPFLNDFDIGLVVDGIINNWNIEDTIVFGQFMEARYKSNSIYDYLSSEFNTVRDLITTIETRIEVAESSLKTGMLVELLEHLSRALQWISRAESTREKAALPR